MSHRVRARRGPDGRNPPIRRRDGGLRRPPSLFRLRSSSFGGAADKSPPTHPPQRCHGVAAAPSLRSDLPVDGRINLDFDHRRARRGRSTHENRMREKLILPAASSLFPNPVPPRRIFLFRFFRNWCLLLTSRARQEGRFAVVTNVGRGMRWTCRSCSALFARRRTIRMRTAKPCGPGIPTLMLSL